MLYDPLRHEPLQPIEWDEHAAARTIERIVADTEERFSPHLHWPLHPLDADGGSAEPAFNLYFGAAGVVWALRQLEARGAVALRRSYGDYADALPALNRAWLRSQGGGERDAASYLMGDTALLMLSDWLRPDRAKKDRLAVLIERNVDHPARELMWGAPGTMLAALFLHERTGESRWAELYVASARKLWSQLVWSAERRCLHWTQDLYGQRSTYLDAVHGFVATAVPLIGGRHLLAPAEWDAWQQCIVTTIRNTAIREDGRANWPIQVGGRYASAQALLMQFCHGAPGFVVCLGGIAAAELDELLIAGGEAIPAAGPLTKGSSLCHGTGGNGYAFLALHARTGDERWLAHARAFAMHAMAQAEAHAGQYGRLRYSLWTGDLGLAIYLHDCIRGAGAFPTLQQFFA
jgi:hypothetical protein